MSKQKSEMPHNQDAEFAVIEAFLLDNALISQAVKLFPCDAKSNEPIFYLPANQIAWEVILELYQSGNPFGSIAFAEEMRRRGLYEKIGGDKYFDVVGGGEQSLLFSMTMVPGLLKIIAEHWKRRVVARVANHAINKTDQFSSTSDLIHRIEDQLTALVSSTDDGETMDVTDTVIDVLVKMESKADDGEVKTGFIELDRWTGGFRKGQMIIIAARPSMGKSAFMQNISDNVAVAQNQPVGLFSLEMSKEELIQRFICSRAKVPLNIVRGRYALRHDQRESLHIAGEQIAKAPLMIDDASTLTPGHLRQKALELKRNYPNLSMIAIDYVQLMGAVGNYRGNRNQELSDISRSIKVLARELEVPIIILAQLSRDVEKRGKNELPKLSDLRDSGALEADADTVIFIHRNLMDDSNDPVKEATIRIGKQRSGPVGDFLMGFSGEYTEFRDLVDSKPKRPAARTRRDPRNRLS